MRTKLAAIAGAFALIVGLTWTVALIANVTISRWVPFRVVQLVVPSRSLYPSLRFGYKGWPWAINSQGDLIAGLDGSRQFAGRFDLRSGTWLKGEIPDRNSMPISADYWRANSSRNTPLIVRKALEQSVAKQIVVFDQLAHGWQQTNAFAEASDGSAWVAGWKSRSRGSTATHACPRSAPGEPDCTPAGWAVIQKLSKHGPVGPAIRIPAAAPIVGLAVGPHGTVWALDDRNACVGTAPPKKCHYPRLISYEPPTGTMKSYSLPKSVWIGRQNTYNPQQLAPLSHILSVAPDGTVWLNTAPFGGGESSLVALRSGKFSHFRISNNLGVASGPFIDRNSDLWFCTTEDEPLIMDGHSGSVTVLSESEGMLFEGPRRDMWYVKYGGEQSVGSC